MTFPHVLRGYLEVHTMERDPMHQPNYILLKNMGYFFTFAPHPESTFLVSAFHLAILSDWHILCEMVLQKSRGF